MRKTGTRKGTKPGLGRKLPEELDLLAAETLKEHLMAGFAEDDDLTLDGSCVERLTTPCIQVLLAAGRAAEKRGSRLRIGDPSEAMTAAFANLGLDAELKRWSE